LQSSRTSPSTPLLELYPDTAFQVETLVLIAELILTANKKQKQLRRAESMMVPRVE
jgi:hypothetical protein